MTPTAYLVGVDVPPERVRPDAAPSAKGLAALGRSGDRRSMRLVLAIVVLAGLFLTACPTPKSPTGPPPQYEDPPAPSWLADGGAGAEAGASADGAAAPTTPLP
jgi:hypothetical protein